MVMKLIETIVSETTVRMRYANNADPAKATQWFDFQFLTAELQTEAEGNSPIGDPESRYVGEVRRAALRRARALIDPEMKRLADLAGRIT